MARLTVAAAVTTLEEIALESSIAALEIDTHTVFDAGSWVAPTLLNLWVNFGGGYDPAGYRQDTAGMVHLRGLIKDGTITSGTVIFTLPDVPFTKSFVSRRTVKDAVNRKWK